MEIMSRKIDTTKKFVVTKGNATPQVFDTYEGAKAYSKTVKGSVIHYYLQ